MKIQNPKGILKVLGEFALCSALGGLGGELFFDAFQNHSYARNPEVYQAMQEDSNMQQGINGLRYMAIGAGAFFGAFGLTRLKYE